MKKYQPSLTWTDRLPSDVYRRLANCRSYKEDIVPLAQAKWASKKAVPGYTKEDALIQILELLDSNSQPFDLTRREYDDILSEII